MKKPERRMPWPFESYTLLEPNDLDETPPSPEQRIRVATALLTYIRDANMLGKDPGINAETVRAVLVMDVESWKREISQIRDFLETSWAAKRRYDAVDPHTRFEQTRKAYSS